MSAAGIDCQVFRFAATSSPAHTYCTYSRLTLKHHGKSNLDGIAAFVCDIVGCVTTVMTVSTATTRHSCLFPGCIAAVAHCLVYHPSLSTSSPSTTRVDLCPVQHDTVRPNLSLGQLAPTGQTWRALRLLPSSNTCTIWSQPWLLGHSRSSIPVVVIEGSFRLLLAPRSRA